MIKRSALAFLIVALLSSFSSHAKSQDKQQNLKTLKKQVADLQRQLAALQAEQEKGISGEEKPAGYPLFGEKVSLGGYGSFRFEGNDIPQVQNSFTLRRLVLTTDASPAERIRIYTEIEYERLTEIEVEKTLKREQGGIEVEQEVEGTNESEISIEQAWGQFDLTENLGFQFGGILVPLGRFNILHDDNQWDTSRRTLVDRNAPVTPAKVAWPEMGLGLVGSYPLGQTGLLSFQAYAMNGVNLDFTIETELKQEATESQLEAKAEFKPSRGTFGGDTKEAKAAAARLSFQPTLQQEVAISAYYGRYIPDIFASKQDILSLGLDWLFHIGRHFVIEGEYIHTDFDDTVGFLSDFARVVNIDERKSTVPGSMLETEVKFDPSGGLAAQKQGFWIDLKWPFGAGLKRTFLGRQFENPQLIPILRYERVWFDDFVEKVTFGRTTIGAISSLLQQDLEQDRLTVGLAYRPSPTVVFHLDLEHSEIREGNQLIFPAGIGVEDFDTVLFGMAFGF